MLKTGSGSMLADDIGKAESINELRHQEALPKTVALQSVIFNSANFL